MESQLQSEGGKALGLPRQSPLRAVYSCIHDHVCDHYSAASLPISPHLKCIPHATLHHPLLDKDQRDTLFIFQQLGSMFCSSVWSLCNSRESQSQIKLHLIFWETH